MTAGKIWSLTLAADVLCSDGKFGNLTRIVVQVSDKQAKALVIHQAGFMAREVVVPVELIDRAAGKSIVVRQTRWQLEAQPGLTEHEYLDGTGPDTLERIAPPTFSPVLPLGPVPVDVEHENITEGQVVVDTSTAVEGADGRLGRLDALNVAVRTGQIITVGVREDHLWDYNELVVPIAAVDRLLDDAIHLSWTRRDVLAYPAPE